MTARRRTSGAGALGAVLVGALLASCGGSGPHPPGLSASAASSSSSSAATPSTGPSAPAAGSTGASRSLTASPTASPTASAAHVLAVHALDAAVEKYPNDTVSVAALDTVTGQRVTAGAVDGIWLASVYKLVVLEALLLRHQDNGTHLTDGEADLATAAIERSDNVAGYALFEAAGGDSGLLSAARRLGVRHLVPGVSDPAFTRTGANSMLRVLRALIVPGPLSARSRAFVLRLMRNVEADQRWGVGVTSDNSDFENKNGWVAVDDSNGPGEDDGGRWIAGSVGIVTVGGHRLLVAVLTQHQSSYDSGVAAVERLARLVTAAAR